MNIKPLFDRVVIKRMEEEKLSAGGIVIPDSATEKPIKGEVIAVGVWQICRYRSQARWHRLFDRQRRRYFRHFGLMHRVRSSAPMHTNSTSVRWSAPY